LTAWVRYGFYWGCKKDKSFIRITLVYWGINVAFVIIKQLFDIIFVYVFTLYISVIPMYGLHYFIQNLNKSPFISDNLVILSIVIFSILGYVSAFIYSKQKINDNTMS
jgi:hypothetical protein